MSGRRPYNEDMNSTNSAAKVVILNAPVIDGNATVAFVTSAAVGTPEAERYVSEYGDRAVSADLDVRADDLVTVDDSGCVTEYERRI